MSATQVDIAGVVGLDVSSVNKILNRVTGPSFKPETIKRVFAVAKQLGYNFNRATKATMRASLERLFPRDHDNVGLSVARSISLYEVIEIKKMLYQGYKIPKERRRPSSV